MSQNLKKGRKHSLGLQPLLQKGVIMTYLFSFFCFFFAIVFSFRLFAETENSPSIEHINPSSEIPFSETQNSSNQESEKESKSETSITQQVNDNANFVPRTILSLFYNEESDDIRYHNTHMYLDMPLHHLGLRVKHWNLANGLPPENKLHNVRGILAYFDTNQLPDPIHFLDWSTNQILNGKKFVLLGELAFYQNKKMQKTPVKLINNFMQHLGLRLSKNTKLITFDLNYLPYDPNRVEFERKLTRDLDPFLSLMPSSPDLDILLSAKADEENAPPSILVSLNKVGGFASEGYYLYEKISKNKTLAQWRINPFEFFRKAFATDDLPKLDTTTLAGRRIYYAHIDGDGWRSISQIPGYKEKNKNCAQVILEEVIQKYSQLPLTVSPIAGDLDPNYFGSPKLMDQAREIFTYPQISIGSHTYTHPLYWKFYDDEDPKNKEKKLFGESQNKVEFHQNKEENKTKVGNNYALPRSYMSGNFDLHKELIGSINFIASLAPKNKKVSLLQWSGDCIPFKQAIAYLRAEKIRNLNGGDSRFDSDYPSYAFVSPIGRDEGDEWQVYASNSNENTYTDGWTERFFGFRYLVNTFKQTETPIRLKPLNVYYHMYSAEKIASLRALIDNMHFAMQQEIMPITAKQFAAIGDGFNEGGFVKLSDNSWRIQNRGALNTIRFDQASTKEVDWDHSEGVIGQNHTQGSLYVALDKRSENPVIALKDTDNIIHQANPSSKHYLVSSRWRLWNADYTEKGMNFIAQGYGPGEMTFCMAKPGKYTIQGNTKEGRVFQYAGTTNENNVLKISVKEAGIEPLALILSETPPEKTEEIGAKPS